MIGGLTMLAVILVILISKKYEEDEDDPCINITIECYNVFNDTSMTSNITSPRALRSGWWAGTTMLFVGSSDRDYDRAYVLVDWDSDGQPDDEFVIFESADVNSSYAPASLALTTDGDYDLYIAMTDMLVKCTGNVLEEITSTFDANR